jgi:hypothetical protein
METISGTRRESSSLLGLPNELITAIAEQIDDEVSLRSLALSCRRIQGLAEPSLYRSIFHLYGLQLAKLHSSLCAKPRRAQYIHSIESRCRTTHLTDLDFLARVVDLATNVRNLILESPFCNVWMASEALWIDEPAWETILPNLSPFQDTTGRLARLTDLTAHWSNVYERYWSFTTTAHPKSILIFSHPNLRRLTLSCVTISGAEAERLRECQRTPLECLILTRVDIDLDALAILLSLPRSLKHLELGESTLTVVILKSFGLNYVRTG